MSLPDVVSPEEWRAARRELLAEEKAMTRARDALSSKRRQLPMVRVETDYRFQGPKGEVSLADLFEGRSQLIVQHFMFDPDWDTGCQSCTAAADELSRGLLDHLHARDTTLRRRVAGAPRQARALQGRAGLGLPLVLVVRQQLQLRLPRDDRRLGRAGRVQLPRRGRAGRGRHGVALGGIERAAGLQRVPAHRRRHLPHVLDVRTRHGVARRGRTRSSTRPRSAARRTGRSPRAAPPACAAPARTSPVSRPTGPGPRPAVRGPTGRGAAAGRRCRGPGRPRRRPPPARPRAGPSAGVVAGCGSTA